MHRPLDPEHIWTAQRGLTGSEGSCLHYAIGLAQRGHDVTLFTNIPHGATVDGLKLLPYSAWPDHREQAWDAAVAWMNPAPLMSLNPGGAFRVLNMQCSDFGGGPSGWESFVDIMCPLSKSHATELSKLTSFPLSKYRIAPNGVSLEEFKPTAKVPGSCLWASSHDRGFHGLLELWPQIRQRVPHATLTVCYDVQGMLAFSKRTDPHPLIQELARRSIYSIEMLKRLEPHGVRVLGSVSRKDIARLMAQSEAMLYPLNPVRYCETFGVSVLEAMASGCVPVIVGADAFQELWAPVCPSVEAPFDHHRAAYLELAVSVLTESKLRERHRSACIGHAHRFAWATLVEKFERFLETRGAEGLEGVA